jgi:hypothetical protein
VNGAARTTLAEGAKAMASAEGREGNGGCNRVAYNFHGSHLALWRGSRDRVTASCKSC